MKAKYKAKVLQKEFLKSTSFYVLFIFKLLFKFSLLNLVKDIWSKFLSIKVFPANKMWNKCGVNWTM